MTIEPTPVQTAIELLSMKFDDAQKVLSSFLRARRRAVLDSLATMVTQAEGRADERRIAALWLLRGSGSDLVERRLQMYLLMAASKAEPESVRVLSLDAIEIMWLAGDISDAVFRNLWTELRDEPSLEIRCRWIRALAQVGAPWSISQIEEALADQRLLPCILNALSASSKPLFASLFAKIEQDSTPSNRGAITEARRHYEVTCTRMRINSSSEVLSDEEAGLLVAAGEFALLHKALKSNRLSPASCAMLREAQIPGEASKSQRDFLRRIKRQLSHTRDA